MFEFSWHTTTAASSLFGDMLQPTLEFIDYMKRSGSFLRPGFYVSTLFARLDLSVDPKTFYVLMRRDPT